MKASTSRVGPCTGGLDDGIHRARRLPGSTCFCVKHNGAGDHCKLDSYRQSQRSPGWSHRNVADQWQGLGRGGLRQVAVLTARSYTTRPPEHGSVTGHLNHGRTDYSATLLPNGQVLVAGGFAAIMGMTATRRSCTIPVQAPGALPARCTTAARSIRRRCFEPARSSSRAETDRSSSRSASCTTLIPVRGATPAVSVDLDETCTKRPTARRQGTGHGWNIRRRFCFRSAERGVVRSGRGHMEPHPRPPCPAPRALGDIAAQRKVLVAGGDPPYPPDPYHGGPFDYPSQQHR